MEDLGTTGDTTLPLWARFVSFSWIGRQSEILNPPLFSLLQFECAAGVTYVLPLQAANFDLSHIYFVAENWLCFMKQSITMCTVNHLSTRDMAYKLLTPRKENFYKNVNVYDEGLTRGWPTF